MLPLFRVDRIDEVILHVGSNDISKGVKQERVIKSMDMACARLKEINPKISITLSSILLQKNDTPKNLRIVETSAALERLS